MILHLIALNDFDKEYTENGIKKITDLSGQC